MPLKWVIFSVWNINLFFSIHWVRVTEMRQKERKGSEGLKARDEECERGAISGSSFPTHTLTLLRLVVVQNGGC